MAAKTTARKGATKAPRKDAARETPVTGIRIPEELRARLDAIVAEDNARLARLGASTSRSALIIRALTEWVDGRGRSAEGA